MKEQNRIFFPNLDGLRFIAFFAVFFHHTFIVKCFSGNSNTELYNFFNAQKQNGALGVNLFFVLSGFLITYLLINEKDKYLKIRIKNFYIRRVLRIWPLYFLMLIIGFIIFPVLKMMLGGVPNETHSYTFYLFFVSNFQVIQKGFADSSILNVLWSVGVEEQFYILWPILLAVIPKKYLLHLFGLLIAFTLIFRYFNIQDADIIYYHTASVFSDMVIGGVVAYLSFFNQFFLRFIENLSKRVIAIIYFTGVCIILFNYKIFTTTFLLVIERFVYALFFAFIIIEQNFAKNSVYKISNSQILSKWGVYTYGLYCLHTIGLLAAHILSEKLLKVHNQWIIMTIDFTVGLSFSMLLAYFSYHLFEYPFLKLKQKFSYFIK